jgi:high-affinity iron transporter
VVLGYLIYNRSIRLNLSKFFTVTGVFLIIVAAGVLSYGIHEYQELGWIPGDGSYAWDISSVIAKDSIAGSLLAGTIGFDVNTTWVQLIFWAAYLTVVLRLYTQLGNRSDKRSNNSAVVNNAR